MTRRKTTFEMRGGYSATIEISGESREVVEKMRSSVLRILERDALSLLPPDPPEVARKRPCGCGGESEAPVEGAIQYGQVYPGVDGIRVYIADDVAT